MNSFQWHGRPYPVPTQAHMYEHGGKPLCPLVTAEATLAFLDFLKPHTYFSTSGSLHMLFPLPRRLLSYFLKWSLLHNYLGLAQRSPLLTISSKRALTVTLCPFTLILFSTAHTPVSDSFIYSITCLKVSLSLERRLQTRTLSRFLHRGSST